METQYFHSKDKLIESRLNDKFRRLNKFAEKELLDQMVHFDDPLTEILVSQQKLMIPHEKPIPLAFEYPSSVKRIGRIGIADVICCDI
jgi:hypothetical protein